MEAGVHPGAARCSRSSARPRPRAPGHRRLPGWVWAFGGLLALGVLSATTVDQTTALIGLRISYFSAFLAIAIWRCPLDRHERDQLVSIFMFMAILTSLVGMWQQVVGHEYLASLGYQYDDQIRFTVGLTLRSFSTFDLPFSFGFYLMLAVLIGLPMSMAEPKRLRSKIFFIALPLIGVAMLYSFVRGAMLGLAIGLLYLAFHRYKLLVFGIPLVLAAALFIPAGATLTNAVFGSKQPRRPHDVLVGPAQRHRRQPVRHRHRHDRSRRGHVRAAPESRTPNLTFQPDNSYLKVTFELGVIGLWLLVMMLVSMIIYYAIGGAAESRASMSTSSAGCTAQLARARGRVARRDLPRARSDGPAVLHDGGDRRDDGAGLRTRPAVHGRSRELATRRADRGAESATARTDGFAAATRSR